jgi:tetratricopeptide (TPR) repeat protein
MTDQNKRLDGWKVIGAHLGRDRTTAIRWANERGMPVRRMPGGKTATVFAYSDELDTWMANLNEDGGQPGAASPTPANKISWHMPAFILGAALLFGIVAVWLGSARSPTVPLPRDKKVAAVYLQARDDWAQRSAPSLARAVEGFQAVVRSDPGFAPAHSGLADAYLLAREFGSLSNGVAYANAKRAAEQALALDPKLADAHRALAFVSYWWEHDPQAAGRAFRRARDLAPDKAQTHFWYGNVLADNGEHVAAIRELNAARLADPGSVAIQTDLAWALWSSGDAKGATEQLTAILSRNPDFAAAYDCLAVIRLAEGDYDGYLRELKQRERLRAEPGLVGYIAALDGARRTGGVPAMQALMLNRALADEAEAPFPDHAWAAFLASVAGDRARLSEILAIAGQQEQKWGSSGMVSRIARRWAGDSQITAALKRRAAPKIE